MTDTAESSLSLLMKDVAVKLLGEPTQKKGKEYRWGRQGSLSVDIEKGTFYDFEAQEGGGVLDLISRENATSTAGALQWLEENGFTEARQQAPSSIYSYDPDRFWLASNGVDVRTHHNTGNTPASEHAVTLRPGQNIVATFDYYGPHGDLLYRNHRIEPGDHGSHKTFRYDHPNGDGGWAPGAGTEVRVPYRLLDILSSKGPFYMVEGEAQADFLACWGFTATSLKGWKDEHSRMIAGRKVYILPDNDEPGEKQAAKAQASLESSHCDVAVVRLPGLPDKGDILDWQGAREDLLALLPGESSAPDPDSGPVDLWGTPAIPEMPIGLLPATIERFAIENAKLIGADPAGLAMAALAACGAALPDRVRAKPKVHENWTQPARLWVLLIGDASTNKSACVSRATDRIESLDVQMFSEANRKIAEWQKDKKDGVEAPKPQRPRLMLGDATVEATQEALKDSPDGLLLRQDEMSSLFAKCGQSSNQAERSFWLQTFNGGSYAVSRIGRGEYIIDNLSVSMLGGIQPTAMHTVVNSGDDDGLIQRFTPIMLREGGDELDVPIPPVNEEFAALIDALRNFPCADNFLNPHAPYPFSERARDVRTALLKDFRVLADNIKSINTRLASHVGKYRGLFVRLCMLFHAIQNTTRIKEGGKPEQEISGATAQRAASFITDYLFRHALAFYRTTGSMTEDDTIVQAIGGWILANDIESFTLRDLVRMVRPFKALKDDQKKERIIGMMEAYGWAEPDPKRQVNKVWRVPAEVAKMYSDKARVERLKRDAVKKIIADAVADARESRSYSHGDDINE